MYCRKRDFCRSSKPLVRETRKGTEVCMRRGTAHIKQVGNDYYLLQRTNILLLAMKFRVLSTEEQLNLLHLELVVINCTKSHFLAFVHLKKLSRRADSKYSGFNFSSRLLILQVTIYKIVFHTPVNILQKRAYSTVRLFNMLNKSLRLIDKATVSI